jgi:16S rRNA (cytidine1402-2'-O)-methyltransferase
MAGALVLVGTPIGNLGDLAPRAIEELGRADLIACEDTRRTGKLLAHAGVTSPGYLVVNEHTEAAAAVRIVERVRAGERVVLVSDAGMPGISDPGERVVRAVLEAEGTVEVIPGPSAVVAALVVSGVAAGRFCFEGFLPRKGAERRERLVELAHETRTTIVYEAPHRLERTLVDLTEVLGRDRRLAIGRELTKLHEEVWRGRLGDAVAWAQAGGGRGELVLVLEGAPPTAEPDDDTVRAALVAAREAGASARDAAAQVAAELGIARRRAYQLTITTQ